MDTSTATLLRWLTGPRFSALRSNQPITPRRNCRLSSLRREPKHSNSSFGPVSSAWRPWLPRFVSVTYGAGGSTQARTHATVARIAREGQAGPGSHLTCVGATRDEVNEVARRYWDAGVRHIVALRGDPPPGTTYQPHPGGYRFASDLVAGLKEVAEFRDFGRGLPGSASDGVELRGGSGKSEAEAGCRARPGRLPSISSIPRPTCGFLDLCLAAGIKAPIVPGIMPVSNYAQIVKFSAMCGASVPDWMGRLFEGTENDPETRRMVGMVVAAEQVRLLQANGVDEFHFYTLNRPDLTYAIAHVLGARAQNKALRRTRNRWPEAPPPTPRRSSMLLHCRHQRSEENSHHAGPS